MPASRMTGLFLATVMLLVSNLMNAQQTSGTTNTDSTLLGRKINKLKLAGNDSTLRNDSSIVLIADTISRNDTVDVNEQSEIKDIITYKAEDSLVYEMSTKKMYLYNAADVKYQQIELKSYAVDFDWNTFNLMARGGLDSTGQYAQAPVFSDNGKGYDADSMKYNFKTKKGIVYQVTTQEGESYLHSQIVKRSEDNSWFGKSTMYTTCDQDHPHFYFKAKKIKMVPEKVLVTGPANLWVGDVPTPLVIPFALFPVKQGRKSGLIMPEYGQDAVFGFFLRNGGYYWAMNDYVGLRFTGQVGTNGTFGAGVAAQYALRYKFNGSLSFNYVRSRPQDPDLPGAKPTNSYSFNWVHTQDPKSIPNSSFGANVQIQSADFFQANRNLDQRLLNTSFNSGVTFSRRFGNLFNLNIVFRHTQNLLNRTIGFTLPEIGLQMSRVAPFKSKVQTGKPKWYENIGFTYSLAFRSLIETYDSTLFRMSTLDKFRLGLQQNVNVDAPITVFKYLNVNPSFSYTETTNFKALQKFWDPDTVFVTLPNGTVDTLFGQVKTDTVWTPSSVRNFSTSLSLSTKVIGIFKFRNSKLKAIKHVFTPTVSVVYNPNFRDPRFRVVEVVQGDVTGTPLVYDRFGPVNAFVPNSSGQVAAINWNLLNNFEMKVFSKKDTVNNERKVGLLDQVSLSGGYNFVADSLNLSPFNLTIAAARIFNLINCNFNAVFDPYAVDATNRRINRFQFQENKRLLRFSTANVSLSTNLNSKPRKNAGTQTAPPTFMGDYVSYNPNQIYDFDIPWNLSLSYRFNITKGTTFNPDTVVTIQSISASLDFNLTPKWKVAISSGFDISRRQLTLTNISVVRDLHCWELSFNWVPPLPTSRFQQFTILLHPRSTTLRDLKLQRRNALQQDF